MAGGTLSMTNYQKVRTTQPQSVKHSTEQFAHGAADPGPRVNDMSKAGAPRGSDSTDDLVKNYNQF